jgi:predicted negative regulator of RcsB-dependent stress response
MKSGLVSAAAVFIMLVIIAVVGLFGYTRYKAAQAKGQEFQAQLEQVAVQSTPLAAHMPEELPNGVGYATPTPKPKQ